MPRIKGLGYQHPVNMISIVQPRYSQESRETDRCNLMVEESESTLPKEAPPKIEKGGQTAQRSFKRLSLVQLMNYDPAIPAEICPPKKKKHTSNS